jgi:hypothetical protein
MVTSGGVAEWLGRGLQSPVLRFESGRRLKDVGTLGLSVPRCAGSSLSSGESVWRACGRLILSVTSCRDGGGKEGERSDRSGRTMMAIALVRHDVAVSSVW